MFFVGIILNGTMVLLPTMMQALMNYPVVTAGFVIAPRGIGTMIAMFLVVRAIGQVDTRLIILTGLALGRGVAMADDRVLAAPWGCSRSWCPGYCRASGSASCSRRSPRSTFSTLPRQLLTQGTALFSLTRNIGGSCGVAIVEALLVENTQVDPFAPRRASAARQPAGAGALSRHAVQPGDPVGDRRA